MMPKLRWLLGITAIAGMATYVGFAPIMTPREPFAEGRWEVESVMVLDPATTTTYKLGPPIRVIRDGDVTFRREGEAGRPPVVRVDLTIDGEHVVMFTRVRQ